MAPLREEVFAQSIDASRMPAALVAALVASTTVLLVLGNGNIALAFVPLAALAGRPRSRWYAALLAATATLAINPRATGDPGWQLSFAAVVGITRLGTAQTVTAVQPRPWFFT